MITRTKWFMFMFGILKHDRQKDQSVLLSNTTSCVFIGWSGDDSLYHLHTLIVKN